MRTPASRLMSLGRALALTRQHVPCSQMLRGSAEQADIAFCCCVHLLLRSSSKRRYPRGDDTYNVAIDECHHFVLTHSHDGVSADSCIAAIPFRSPAEHDDIAADQRGFTARATLGFVAVTTDRVRHHGCLRTVPGRDP